MTMPTDFWTALDRARALIMEGPEGRKAAAALLQHTMAALDSQTAGPAAELAAEQRSMLAGFVEAHRLEAEMARHTAPPETRPAEDPAGEDPTGEVWAGEIPAGVDPEGLVPLPPAGSAPQASAPVPLTVHAAARLAGTSLVTCCKNRNENLVRALPSWLALPDLAEIVIVDWSSDQPVTESLTAAGIQDPRIRVARVEGEPRWILSYAFNLGFRVARGEKVLKADADIVLDPAFFAANPLAPGQFIAGNWRRAGAGQEFVNGFFYTHHADLMRVNGFNEYITTYGWDDDELYDRLVAAGVERVDVAPDTVRHLDHDDDARMDRADTALSGWDDLHARTMFKIRTNRFIATMMPTWDQNRIMMPYGVTADPARPGLLRLERSGTSIHLVPAHMRRMAEILAGYELLSWRVGLRVFNLPQEALDLLLACRRFEAITALHVELMLAEAGLVAVAAPRHLVIDLEGGGPWDEARLAAALAAAAQSGRQPVLRAPCPRHPLPNRAGAAGLPFAPSYYQIGPARDVSPEEIATDPWTPVLRIRIAPAQTTPGPVPLAAPLPLAAPVPLGHRAARLYIDAQHGLGNRMRAIGSAAAVAAATGRELVVVWTPDHHCEGRLSDLFDYDSPVIEESPLPALRRSGGLMLNYMEIEEGAAKGAPLVLTEGQDACVRSAYVINHPASTWDSENALLRRLRPAAPVRALLEPLPARIDIGLHVRMEGMPGTDTNSYDRLENWTPEGHAAIHHWREQSHYARFMARLDALLEEEPEAQIWLAADLPETYRAFAETYGPRVAMLERPLYDRSAAQLHYALADILMLARARHFLGSNWSSFSELALRLSDSIRRHERSGVDF